MTTTPVRPRCRQSCLGSRQPAMPPMSMPMAWRRVRLSANRAAWLTTCRRSAPAVSIAPRAAPPSTQSTSDADQTLEKRRFAQERPRDVGRALPTQAPRALPARRQPANVVLGGSILDTNWYQVTTTGASMANDPTATSARAVGHRVGLQAPARGQRDGTLPRAAPFPSREEEGQDDDGAHGGGDDPGKEQLGTPPLQHAGTDEHRHQSHHQRNGSEWRWRSDHPGHGPTATGATGRPQRRPPCRPARPHRKRPTRWRPMARGDRRQAPSPRRRSGRATFSDTVSSGSSSPNWNTEPMHSRGTRARWRADMTARFTSPRRTTPPATPFSPDRQCSKVVLPEPLGPLTATELPAETSRSTPSRMTRPPANARRPRHPRSGACDALRLADDRSSVADRLIIRWLASSRRVRPF